MGGLQAGEAQAERRRTHRRALSVGGPTAGVQSLRGSWKGMAEADARKSPECGVHLGDREGGVRVRSGAEGILVTRSPTP